MHVKNAAESLISRQAGIPHAGSSPAFGTKRKALKRKGFRAFTLPGVFRTKAACVQYVYNGNAKEKPLDSDLTGIKRVKSCRLYAELM